MSLFVDAQKLGVENPSTFQVPTTQELDKIKPNDFVKVCACNERFWVKVIKVNKKTSIVVGVIDNDLIFSHGHGLKLGDKIKFNKNNIYSIIWG